MSQTHSPAKRHMRTMRAVACCVGLLMMRATVATATPITIPPSLAPGSTYFLAFVTAGSRDATSSNIADYDAFVTTEALMDPALAALSTSWKVIGSTATVDAITHIAVTGPVYRLDGVKIASGSADMFDGDIDAPLSFDQHGIQDAGLVWTGSNRNGLRNIGNSLGANGLSVNTVSGSAAVADFEWIERTSDPQASSRKFYGVSGPLEVPQAVPEPGTISLMLGPALALIARHRRRRARPATPATRSDPASH